MSIENRVGDIFQQRDVNVIVHQANLYHTFGAGIAAIIAKHYPYAYEADCKTLKGSEKKLGTYSVGKSPTKGDPTFVNMYSQVGIGGERNTRYDAMVEALEKLEKTLAPHANKFTLGIPYTIGCGLAGGDWRIVKAIIESIFEKSPLKAVVCRLPSQPLVAPDIQADPIVASGVGGAFATALIPQDADVF